MQNLASATCTGLSRRRFVAAFILALLLPLFVASQPATAQGIRDRYKKYEYMIPMRDGVKLYTSVYVPLNKPGKHPILLERTPYGAGPVGPDAYRGGFRGSPKMQEAGYIFAYQDVRGKGASEGDFENVRPQLKPGQKGIDESTDTYDAVDYLVKNVPENSGRVGLWGISYPGFYAGVGVINTHPSLVAVSPQAPVTDWFIGDDVHHNGAFFLQDTFDFMLFFDVPRPKTPGAQPRFPRVDRGDKSAYDFYLSAGALSNYESKFLQGAIPYWNNDLMAHGTYDQYWKDRALQTKMKNVRCAVLTVGGWFDAEDNWGALNLYRFTEKQNPGIYNALVMGPWSHGQWASKRGDVFSELRFGQNTSTYYEDTIEFPFFERFLNGNTSVTPPAEVTVFETGTNRWRTFDKWPFVTQPLDVFLAPNRTLKIASAPSQSGTDAYTYDPAAPTPYIGEWQTSKRRPAAYMGADQRWAVERKDVLTYVSEPLTADTTLAGLVSVEFWAATTGTDADFVVKVCDVYPDSTTELSGRDGENMGGRMVLIRGDILRGKFRDSLEKPTPFVPNKPTLVKFTLNETLHTFRKGHRMVIQVQSAWFPLVDRNPNQFVDIYKAKDSDFVPATISLFYGGKYPSKLRFGVLK